MIANARMAFPGLLMGIMLAAPALADPPAPAPVAAAPAPTPTPTPAVHLPPRMTAPEFRMGKTAAKVTVVKTRSRLASLKAVQAGQSSRARRPRSPARLPT